MPELEVYTFNQPYARDMFLTDPESEMLHLLAGYAVLEIRICSDMKSFVGPEFVSTNHNHEFMIQDERGENSKNGACKV